MNCDVVVLGSGPAGLYCALSCAGLGKRAILVERDRLGGTGFRWGCLPVKMMLDRLRIGAPESRTDEDDFGKVSSGWTVSSGSIGTAKYENSGYHLLTQKANQLIAGTNAAIGQLADFAIGVDARSVASSQDTSHGIIFRQSDIDRRDNFYYFSISSNSRQYRLVKKLNGVTSALKDWTDSNSINQAPSINYLTLVCRGTQIELGINNSILATLTDSSFIGGFIWLTAESGSSVDSRADVIFDNMVIKLPD